MRKRRGVGIVQSRWLVVLAASLLVASGRASAADLAPEIVPIVVSDPGTGAVVKIWSDGFTAKLTWARQDASGWSASHALTWGLGIDRAPAVGTTSAGSWLFWRSELGEVLYAPLELSAGRLLGAPAPLQPSGGILPGSLPRTEGGMDTPVVLGHCDDGDLVCIAQRNPPGPSNPPGQNPPPVMEGGLDSPTTLSPTSPDPTLIVSSEPTCERQIVTIAQPGDSVLVLEVDGAGRVHGRKAVTLQDGVTAEDAGRFFLAKSCKP